MNSPSCRDAAHGSRLKIVISFEKVAFGQGNKSHEAAEIHQAFRQHHSSTAADCASAAME